MPAVYDKILVKGSERYRRDKQFVKKDAVPANVMDSLTLENIVDENGTVIVEDKGDFGGDTTDSQETTTTNPGDTTATQPPVDQDKVGTPQPQGDPAAHATANPPAAAPTGGLPPAETAKLEQPSTPDGNPGTPEALPSQPEGAAQAMAEHPGRNFKSKVPQSEAGMDFPRKAGKTVDIFNGQPHTHVRYVGGHMVPLTRENYLARTDAEIEAKLKELGKEVVDLTQYETGAADSDDDGGLSDDKV